MIISKHEFDIPRARHLLSSLVQECARQTQCSKRNLSSSLQRADAPISCALVYFAQSWRNLCAHLAATARAQTLLKRIYWIMNIGRETIVNLLANICINVPECKVNNLYNYRNFIALVKILRRHLMNFTHVVLFESGERPSVLLMRRLPPCRLFSSFKYFHHFASLAF